MTIEQKLQQMYAALRGMELKDKLPMIQPQVKRTGNQDGKVFDLNQVADGATAANQVSLLLNNVACLKDHLKAWCNKNGKPFTGEDLINKNRDVAIIHDLWNLDKHAELNRPSRSGLSPRLQSPPVAAIVPKGSSFVLDFRMVNGRLKSQANLRIAAIVVDEHGNSLGSLEDIVLRAVTAWEAEFVRTGVTSNPS
ncbi:MAG TPA: hypothetical protein VN939_11775 [Chthoniobacterales bacterium]|jgi:hypothetical protein|nr:hypothetical protein [Chthoniobacterales bacterium]